MPSLHQLPTLFLQLSTVLLKNAQFTQTPPLWSLFQLPSLFLQNAEFTATPHCPSKKCEVCFNSPLCFYEMCSLHEPSTVFLSLHKLLTVISKMWSSHELLLCGVHLNSHSVLKKCRVQVNSPLCSPNMRSLFQLPTLFLQNAESI